MASVFCIILVIVCTIFGCDDEKISVAYYSNFYLKAKLKAQAAPKGWMGWLTKQEVVDPSECF